MLVAKICRIINISFVFSTLLSANYHRNQVILKTSFLAIFCSLKCFTYLIFSANLKSNSPQTKRVCSHIQTIKFRAKKRSRRSTLNSSYFINVNEVEDLFIVFAMSCPKSFFWATNLLACRFLSHHSSYL